MHTIRRIYVGRTARGHNVKKQFILYAFFDGLRAYDWWFLLWVSLFTDSSKMHSFDDSEMPLGMSNVNGNFHVFVLVDSHFDRCQSARLYTGLYTANVCSVDFER